MPEDAVSLRDAKARLSELTERAAAGAEIVIAKHGRATARLVAAQRVRKPIDLAALQALVRAMPKQREGAGRALRRLRAAARY